MIWRFFSFFLMACVGAGLGIYSDHPIEAFQYSKTIVIGALCGTLLWWLMDALRGLRVIRWLREGDLAQAPQMMGIWGEVVDRSRRLLRDKQKALQLSDQRLIDFLQAIQASPNGVILLDHHDQIEWCNQTAANQLGIDSVRDLGQRIGNLVRDPLFTDYMHAQSPEGDVVLTGRSNSESHPLRVSVQRHVYGDGKQLLLTRDVTALEQAEAMRRDFVANVSHEIRTPLTVLSGFVETMQSLPLNEEDQTRYLSLMASQAQRMQSLVEDLLTLSRLEGSPIPNFQNSIVLSQLIEICLDEGRALSKVIYAGKASQQLKCELDEGLHESRLLGETGELHSALSNLISNAVRYGGVGGQILIKASLQSDDQLCLAVLDTGNGIAPEHISRLTERFYRVDRSRSRESGGTGLGLAIVKHIIQRHGGHLRIESVQGKGSQFSLIFPLERWRLK